MATSTNDNTSVDNGSEQTSWKALLSVGIAVLVLIGTGFYAASTRSDLDTSETTQSVTEESPTPDGASHEDSSDETFASAQAEIKDGVSTETFAIESDDIYRYAAGVGESYTLLARQSIRDTDSGLTSAERVAAETKLTQDAGAPLLEVAEEVTITKADVQQAIDWAKALSAGDKAAWQYYADQVEW